MSGIAAAHVRVLFRADSIFPACHDIIEFLTGIIERRRKAFERMVLLGNAILPLRRVCTMLCGGVVCVKGPRKGNGGHGGVVVKAT